MSWATRRQACERLGGPNATTLGGPTGTGFYGRVDPITQWYQPGMISPEERGAASAGAGAVRSYDVNATARFRLLRPELGDQPARPGAVTQQPGYLRVTRKMDPFASSLTSSAPSRVTATPAGRAQTLLLSITKPVMKSSYSPVGLPSFMRTRITL